MSYENERFARNLSRYMAEAGVGVEALAERSGVSVFSIRDYLGEKSVPRLDTGIALAEALGCTVNDLCGFAGVA